MKEAHSADRQGRSLRPATWLRHIVRRDLLGVFYHLVSERRLPHVEHLYTYKTPAAFEQDLIRLRERHTLVGDEEIHRARASGTDLHPPAANLSFDDGFAECFTVVRPLLKRYEVPCTFFVVTGALDNRMLMHRNTVSLCLDRLRCGPSARRRELTERCCRCPDLPPNLDGRLERHVERLQFQQRETIERLCDCLEINVSAYLRDSRPYLTGDQVRQLHAEGFTIGAHTVTHPELWLIRDRQEVEREIVESCATVRDLTGQKTVPFAFPFNGLWCSRDWLVDLRTRHPFVGLIYDSNNLMRDHDFVINRVWCDAPDPAHPQRSNVEAQLRRAFRLEPFRRLRRRLRRRGS